MAVAAMVFLSPQVRAASSTWNIASGGLWSATGNWASTVVASGTDATADFNSVNITSDTTVHLDSSVTLQSLIFGDTDTSSAAGWTLDNNGVTSNVLTLAGNSIITVNDLGAGKYVTIGTSISGTSGLNKAGSGKLVLSGTSAYTGATTISGGTLTAGSSNIFSTNSIFSLANTAGVTLDLAGYNNTVGGLSGGGSTGGNVTLGSGTLTIASSANATYSGVIAGSGGIIETGTYTQTLSGANTYDGVTTVSGSNGGSLSITNANALGSTVGNTVVKTGATLKISGNITVAEALNISGQGSSSTGAALYSTGNNTLSGVITVGSSIAEIMAASGTLNITGGVVGANNNLQLSTNSKHVINVTNNAINVGNAAIWVGDNGGAVNLGVAGNTYGTLIFWYGVTLNTTVANALCATGTLQFATGSLISGTAGPLIVDLNGNDQTIGGLLTSSALLNQSGTRIITSANAATLTVNQSSSTAFDGSITGAVSLVKNGSGMLTLSGTSTYTGATTVGKGTLSFNSLASGTNAQTLGASNTVNLGVASTSSGILQYNGAAGTLDKNIYALGSGLNTIQNSGSGLLTLSGSLVKNGTILVLNGGSSGVNVTGVISGSNASYNSDLYVTGGSVTLSATNTYYGSTWVYGGGVLVNGATNVLPTNTALVLGGTSGGTDNSSNTYNLNGYNQTIASLTGTGTGTQTVTNGSANTTSTLTITGGGTYKGGIVNGSGTTALNLTGGTLALGGNNTYDGVTTVSGNGTVLSISNANALGSTVGNTVVGTGAKLQVGGNITVAEAITLNGEGSAYDGVLQSISGVNTLSGAITLGASAERIYVASGTLNLTGGVVGANSNLTIAGSHTLNITTKALNLGSSGILWVADTGITTLGVTGNTYGTVVLEYGGTLKTTAANALCTTGTIQFATGALMSGTYAALTLDLNGYDQTIGGLLTSSALLNQSGTRIITSANAATLTVNQSSSTIFDGSITGAISLVKSGSGMLTLTGTSTYTGATSITGGTLAVNGSLAANSTVTVNGATLAGSGIANGTVSVASGTINGTGLTLGATTFDGVSTLAGITNATSITDNSGTLTVSGTTTSGLIVNSGATVAGSGQVIGTVSGSNSSINGSGLRIGATTLNGSSTLSGYNIASSVTVNSGTTSLTGTTQSTSALSVSAGATLNANGTIAGSANISGLLKGNSMVTGNLALTSGTLSPGNSAGTTTVGGNFTMDKNSTMVAQVSGAVAGISYDQVKVSGNITLDGTLDLTTLSGLTLGETITLIDNTGSGTTLGYFSTILTSGSTYTVTSNADYTFTSGTTEYLLSYNTFSATSGVNFNDVTLTVVPEPSTWAMLIGGIGMLAFGQRLRRRSP